MKAQLIARKTHMGDGGNRIAKNTVYREYDMADVTGIIVAGRHIVITDEFHITHTFPKAMYDLFIR